MFDGEVTRVEMKDILPAWMIWCPEVKEDNRGHLREIGMDYRCVQGIHGEAFGLRGSHVYGKDKHDLKKDYVPIPKHVGIHLSHYMVWTAMKLSGRSACLVVESDCRFSEVWFDEIAWALKEAGEFDLLMLGSCHTGLTGERRVMEVREALCTHAYVIRDSALEVLLKTQRDCYSHVDISMCERAFPELLVKAVIPRIAEQDRELPP